ncbi:MAG: hypothetical protein LBT86_03585 [Deltaproteobacteria bacterium]|jgi:hypothetical protein|nr:hypothetical protein [Deltaproteobacteria bacterium]
MKLLTRSIIALALLVGMALGFSPGMTLLWGEERPNAEPQEPVSIQQRAAAQLIVTKLDIQTELPRTNRIPPPNLNNDGFILPTLLKSLFCVVVFFILFTVIRSLARHLGTPTPPKPSEPENAVLGQRLAEIGRDSQRLAENGRYAEAIHQLLLKSLLECQKLTKITFAPSLTSREILNRLKLGSPVEPALAFMVAKVEVSHFGRYWPVEADYQACLDNFKALVEGLKTWSPA